VQEISSNLPIWTGPAVLSGTVTANFYAEGETVPRTAEGPLAVVARLWRWSSSDPDPSERSFAPNGGLECVSFPTIVAGPGQVFGQNTNVPQCLEHDGMIQPDPRFSGLGGWTGAAVTVGPNKDIWFVYDADWRIDRGSLVNTSLLNFWPGKHELTTNKDKNACQGAVPTPGFANWYEFNEFCKGGIAEPFISGIESHEGYGTLGPGAPEPNGHQARIEQAATSSSGDPYRYVEGITDTSIGLFSLDVPAFATHAQDSILVRSDPGHEVVKNNWCGTMYVYDGTKFVSWKFTENESGQSSRCP